MEFLTKATKNIKTKVSEVRELADYMYKAGKSFRKQKSVPTPEVTDFEQVRIELNKMEKEENPIFNPEVKYELPNSKFLGLTLEGAVSLAIQNGLEIRPLIVDGEEFAGTMDLNPKRVNVAIEKNIVMKVLNRG